MIDELIPVKVLATHTIANVSEGLAKQLGPARTATAPSASSPPTATT